jgi:peptidoglycan/xylan/chitin deacetylase (PgdA/CDA1 family)
VNRTAVVAAVGVIVALVLLGVAVEPAFGSEGAGGHGALFRVHTKEKVVALTFDDGPDPRWTLAVLAALAVHHDHATFFTIGRNAVAHPEIEAQIRQAGDEIGNHTFDHPRLPTLSSGQVRSQLESAQTALMSTGDPRPVLFRPPYGLTNHRVEAVASKLGLRTVLWGACVERYVDHGPVTTGTQRLLDRVKPGEIILAHDGGVPDRSRTMEALPQLLDGLAARGYRVVTVSQLLALRRSPARPVDSTVPAT